MQSVSITQFIIAVASASFATFLGSAAVELLKNARKDKKTQEEYRAQIGIELDQIVKLIIRLKSDYKARKYFGINLIETLRGAILRVEERLKALSLIADNDLQRRIYETVVDCRLLINEVSGTESWIVEKDITKEEQSKRIAQAVEDRPERNVELSDMQRRIEELVRDLKV